MPTLPTHRPEVRDGRRSPSPSDDLGLGRTTTAHGHDHHTRTPISPGDDFSKNPRGQSADRRLSHPLTRPYDGKRRTRAKAI